MADIDLNDSFLFLRLYSVFVSFMTETEPYTFLRHFFRFSFFFFARSWARPSRTVQIVRGAERGRGR